MVQINLVLDTRRSKLDGTYPIIFRIIQLRTVYTISSGISISKIHWDDKKRQVSHDCPNASRLNLKLTKRHVEIQSAILQLEDDFTIEGLKELLDKNHKPISQTTFKAFADELIAQMYSVKRTGNAIVYQTAVNRFLLFCNKPNIKFNEINYSLLDRFSHDLKLQGLKQNSISNYFRSLRAIYNKAIKAKIIDRSLYPFFDIKIKTEKTAKRAIIVADFTKLNEVVKDNQTPTYKALKYFLLSFYLIGISFTDMAYLTNNNVIDGRIVYRRRKTHKEYSIKLFPKAKAILESFNQEDSKYLIPILPNNVVEDSLRAKKLIHQWIKTTNKYIKRLGQEVGIASPLTTYVARHQFATTAKRLGYSNELIAEALGHEYGNKITNIYLDSFDQEVVDDMHKRVIANIDHQ
jgi:site-specific recombinase XerD